MHYLWLKALHIIAVVTWIGGMLAVALVLGAVSGARGEHGIASRSAFLGHVRQWDQRVTTTAMSLAWIAGLALALTGQWFPQTWLLIKLAIVLLLSALHGMLSGRLRRLVNGEPAAPAGLHHAPAAILLGMLVIVALVVTKPF